jgi:16S rRNA (uracil1498-N3)-methyltransferase
LTVARRIRRVDPVRVNRFFSPELVERDGVVTVPDREIAGQISRVLRLPIGAPVEICDGSGRVVSATLLDVSRDAARFAKTGERRANDAASVARRVDLYPSVIKGDHLSLVVEKATELGAALVAPVIAARSVKRDANVARLARIAREAAEQCGRATVPEVRELSLLADALEVAGGEGAKIIALDQEAEKTFSEVLAGAARVAIFVGPEGGWDERDRALLAAARAEPAALGGFVLRAETASIVACALAARR